VEIAFGTATRAEARANLVYGPYLTETRPASIITAVGGACTKLRRRFARPLRQRQRSVRGRVRDFSRRSRTRLQQTLCAIPIAHVGRGLLFVTLTYPRDYPGDWQVWKRHLDTMLKRFRRRFPSFAAVWKLEPQKRGAPHYHLLVVGVPFIAADWLRQSWTAIVGGRVSETGWARVNVQLARSHKGVVSYAAKYTAKYQALPPDWQDGVGRWWGVCNRDGLGIVWKWAPLSDYQYWVAVRVVRQLIAHRALRRSRSPPRACHSGMWAVLEDWQALRVAKTVRCIERIGPPHRSREYIGARSPDAGYLACNL